MIILGILSAFPPNLAAFMLIRTLFGVVAGVFSPLAYTILAEITPTQYRGRYMVLLGIFYVIGELTVCLIATVTLDNFEGGNWNAMLVWTAIPAFFAWVASIFILDESPRQEMILGKTENSIKILKKMYMDNKGVDNADDLMTPEEEQ
mmetsp:Transcript_2483/g.2112  ORF Transcript_2483/g.2112 Transcript_2483/m.2112 type:complete len:148 (+) Transcript_2483:595-1038(+)